MTDTWDQKADKALDQPFMFTEPAGRYVAGGPGGTVHLVIRPGRATEVTIPDGCF